MTWHWKLNLILLLEISSSFDTIRCELLKQDDPTLFAGLLEGDIAGVTHANKALLASTIKKWDNGIIYYKVGDELAHVARRAIIKAVEQFSQETCLRFVEATHANPDYIIFRSERGCWSHIGKKGGRQEISIGPGCETVGVVLHEIMHVLGFWHENSRTDAGRYVTVDIRNVAIGEENHLSHYINPEWYFNEPYDYDSITHMSPFAFAKDSSKPTIQTRDERFSVGQRKKLSQGDVNKIVKLYCPAKMEQLYKDIRPMANIGRNSITTEAPGGAYPVSDCKDSFAQNGCQMNAVRGFCYKNKNFMRRTCPYSCNFCGDHTSIWTNCEDSNSNCELWAMSGMCADSASWKYMHRNCPLSCGICIVTEAEAAYNSSDANECVDIHSNCPQWSNYCSHMDVLNVCPRTCNKCPQREAGKQMGPQIMDFYNIYGQSQCSNMWQASRCPTAKTDRRCSLPRVRQNCKLACGLC